jgi:hypothetical protein|tara:strand:+ start:1040 stop:1234 length:195 start_codon:yes stop_codon:yes gene_type:complete
MAVASKRRRRIPTGFDDFDDAVESVKIAKAKKIDSDRSRLTDHNGKLKFLKTSKYLQTLTQGEE